MTLTTLHEARLEDLQRLVELRGPDRLRPHQRDGWMFAAAVCVSHLVRPEYLQRELITLGQETAGWDEDETRTRMQAVLSRAQRAADGKTVEWTGQRRDPRYRLKNQTIIESLQITAAEEESMKTIISSDTKRRRGRERKERERRARGSKPRAEYLADSRNGHSEAYDRFEVEDKKQLDRLHFPTKRISLEDFIEHLIVEIGVTTKHGKEAALEVLADSRRGFEEGKRTKGF